jgi:hypothetical protein
MALPLQIFPVSSRQTDSLDFLECCKAAGLRVPSKSSLSQQLAKLTRYDAKTLDPGGRTGMTARGHLVGSGAGASRWPAWL